jgi:hypothetical protein
MKILEFLRLGLVSSRETRSRFHDYCVSQIYFAFNVHNFVKNILQVLSSTIYYISTKILNKNLELI